MDAKDRIAFQNAIMVEVRQIINAKFKGSSEEISDDSKIAIQQLINMNSALRDEFNRLAAGAKLTATCVEELQKKVSVLESTPVSARAPADIANLKASMVKVQDALASDQTKTRLAALEKSMTELTPIVAGLSNGLNNGVAKRSVYSTAPSPSLTPDPNGIAPPLPSTPTPTLSGPLDSKNDDPNAAGGPGGVEIKSSDVNRRLTSLEGRIKAIPQPVPYDDSVVLQRLGAAENKIGDLATRVTTLEAAPAQPQLTLPSLPFLSPSPQGVDLTPLQTSLATLEAKVNVLAGQAATFQTFDPTPLASRISKLEASNGNSNQPAAASVASPLGGLFGIGSQPSDVAMLKTRVDMLEANFQALVKVGVSKGEFEPVAQELNALKARVEALKPTPIT